MKCIYIFFDFQSFQDNLKKTCTEKSTIPQNFSHNLIVGHVSTDVMNKLRWAHIFLTIALPSLVFLLPEASFGLRLSVSVCVNPKLSNKSSPIQARMTNFKWGWLTLTFKVKFNFKSKFHIVIDLSTRLNAKIIFESLQSIQWEVCLVQSLNNTYLRGGGTHLHLRHSPPYVVGWGALTPVISLCGAVCWSRHSVWNSAKKSGRSLYLESQIIT